MLSLIEVKCPHCGANGQIMLPPVGTIIVGPCPVCQELVVVFCGHVLPLHKDTMLNGTLEQKREHMLSVLVHFLKDRVAQIISDESVDGENAETPGEPPAEIPSPPVAPPRAVQPKAPPISHEEAKAFTDVELKLLDNPDYFRTIFQ